MLTLAAKGMENAQHEYDENGNPAKLVTFGKSGDLIDRKGFEYEYDAQGN